MQSPDDAEIRMRGDEWFTVIEITGSSKQAVIKKRAAVKKELSKLAKQREKPRREKGEGSFFQRKSDGMWIGRVPAPSEPDGPTRRYEVSSMDRVDAANKFEEMKLQLAKGLEPLDKRMSLATWLKYWLDEIAKPRMKPQPWKTYRGLVNNQIIPAIGTKRLATLRAEHIRFMHKHILASTYTRRDKATGRQYEVHYSTRTVEAAHNVLSGALTDALEEGKVHRNWCEIVRKPMVLSVPRGALSSEVARQVLVVAMQRQDRMVTRWAAGLMLGGRQGELLGLQVDRIDFEKGGVDLAWQLEWLPLKRGSDSEDPERFDVPAGFEHVPLWRGAALTRPKTTKSKRLTPLPQPLAAILKVYLEKYWQPNPWNLVWVSANGTPISDRADREGWEDAQTAADVEPVEVHGMRGTTATLLLEAGVDVKIVMAILGHASEITTRGYQQVNLELAAKALGNLDVLLELEGG